MPGLPAAGNDKVCKPLSAFFPLSRPSQGRTLQALPLDPSNDLIEAHAHPPSLHSQRPRSNATAIDARQ